jgi:hypothetical protein
LYILDHINNGKSSNAYDISMLKAPTGEVSEAPVNFASKKNNKDVMPLLKPETNGSYLNNQKSMVRMNNKLIRYRFSCLH